MVMPRGPVADRYGRLAVVAEAPGGWLCRCDCGADKIVTGNHLRSGAVSSCGCLHRELQQLPTKHGKTRTRVYNIWCGIVQRCTNPKNPDFANYGGRGIGLCEAWHDFEAFYAAAGDPPPDHSIDRIKNDRGYEPGNVQWALKITQARNTRRNRQVTLRGETKPLAQWCDDLGLKYWTVHARLRRGSSIEEALR